jgi:glycosyltransferase involved in cell wall biosynthesis
LSNPSISLVVISNNSESTISRTFQSVDSLVDEIILVDTGITDSTLEIAHSFKAKILPYKWVNNFALAKNFGIAKASCEWVLILDSDEFLLKEDLPLIKEAVKDRNAGAFIFTQRSAKEGGAPLNISCIRLFRNIENLRLEYAVHEMLKTEVLKEKQLELKNLDIIIEHSGYQSAELLKRKEKRNLNILKTQLLKEKLSEADYFHYGVYFLRSNLAVSGPSAIEKNIGEKVLEIKNKRFKEKPQNLNQDFFIFYAVMPEFLFKYSKAEQVNDLFREAAEIYKDSPYIFFKFAGIFYKMGNYRASIDLLEKCLSFKEKGYNPEQLVDPGILGPLSQAALDKIRRRS